MAIGLKAKLAGLILLAALSVASLAAPAPWYQWRSKLDGQVHCAQTDPGTGWEKVGGPYQDARCIKPGKPGYWIPDPAK
jgi:hypothetical protein